uniref:Nose resistant-to-fluoxetine protein N-terminal domain-containing protein n=1 Tax=Panagrolaimus sp. PS1159 TaxID=55785 RepID=A0AC35GYJ0_9BILA
MPSGISDGNYHWLGDYEQCEMLKLEKKFNGHYCMIEFEVPDTVLNTKCDNQPLDIHLGICLPASCKLNETKAIIEDIAQHKMDVYCEPPSEWHTREITFLIVFLCWCFIIFVATIWIWKFGTPETKTYIDNIVEAFSLQHNLRKCLRTTRKRTMFHSIDGLQVVSIALLVNGNIFFLIMEYLGYTNSNTFWKHLLSRFFRVWPSYAFVTLFVSHLYIRLGYGPMWSHNDLPYRCEKTWWENLLLINNILGFKETCLDGGFLFALEAQFYLVAIVIIFIRRKNKAASNTVIGALITLSTAYIFIITNYYKTYATLIPTASAFKTQPEKMYADYVNKIFLSPIARISPFLFGLGAPLWCPIKFNITMKKV